jgi:NTE family protein
VIERHLPYRTIEQAALPLHLVATALLAGGTVCLSSGPVVEAVLASCAIPAAFPPVRLRDSHLIDGAIPSNTPISMTSPMPGS